MLPEPLVQHDSFFTLRLSLNEQVEKSRYALHLLHYIPERRGKKFDTLQDVIPVHDIGLTLNLPEKIKDVRLVPEGERLEFTQSETTLSFTLPKLVGHQMLELRYENNALSS